MLELNQIHCMNCIDGLKRMEPESVDCCVTSPPYWGLRDYGRDGQIGLEHTPEQYVQNTVAVFSEVRRVLKKTGTLWLNLGDTYISTAPGTMGDNLNIAGTLEATKRSRKVMRRSTPSGMKPKDLVGIPWMVAFALRADGWYLRSDIIWNKSNPMPESVVDRPTKAHEYIFLLSRSSRYFYDADAIKEPVKESSLRRLSQNIEAQNGSQRANGGGKTNGPMEAVMFGGNKAVGYGDRRKSGKECIPTMAAGVPNIDDRKHKSADGQPYIVRNKRSVWEVPTAMFKEAHFATFPPRLIEPCILAGCPVGGVVLDPFMGSGTTAMVALQLQRNFIGFELNPDYIEIAEKYRLRGIQQRII